MSHRRAQLLELANAALQRQEFASAEQFAAEILKASRTDPAATMIMAKTLIAQNRAAESIAPLEKAIRRTSDASFETLLGVALASANRHADAIELLHRAAARRPIYIPALQELTGQLARAGRTEEAIAVAETGLASAPDNAELQLGLARLYLEHNRREEARTVLLEARETSPNRPEILIALARVLLLDGDYISAADAFRHALAHRPDDALTRADFAACLFEMGDREAGEANLRVALNSNAQMLGRATFALTASSHGRFFFRPSSFAKFLQGKPI